ncbi:MAG: hypothetical protein P8N26_07710 [Cyclobacteriaceae bacterium]|nr:hypothetical protein [Cyclobacteriaceae bacterium]
MMRSVLIYESTDELPTESYKSPIIQALSKLTNTPDYFHLDAFSDALFFELASQFIAENTDCLIILTFESEHRINGLSKILNQVLQNTQEHTLISLNTCILLEKLKQKIPISFFEAYDPFIQKIKLLLKEN